MRRIRLARQEGSVLVFSLIVLGALFISTLAMYRSTETTTIVAGNISFKQAASTTGDIGVNWSVSAMQAVGDSNVTVANQYYAVQQPIDGNGLPTTVDWAQVASQQVGNYTIQYVIERLCTGTLPISDPQTACYQKQTSQNGSKKVGAQAYVSHSMFYRVTVRVSGPKNTTSFIQAILQET